MNQLCFYLIDYLTGWLCYILCTNIIHMQMYHKCLLRSCIKNLFVLLVWYKFAIVASSFNCISIIVLHKINICILFNQQHFWCFINHDWDIDDTSSKMDKLFTNQPCSKTTIWFIVEMTMLPEAELINLKLETLKLRQKRMLSILCINTYVYTKSYKILIGCEMQYSFI